jgi:hypothetical protein
MKMLVHVKLPHEPFNTMVRNGTVGKTLNQILQDIKPEAVYFTNYDGQRGAIMIVDVADPSKVPMIAEPWFLVLNANVEFHIVMNPDDLQRANLDTLGKKWGTSM